MTSKKNNKPKLVSLFSGCGGMDVGFERAGFNRIWANDFDRDAQRIFEHNLGPVDGRDIREVPSTDIPSCDILTAGFPCQPFSNAGNRKGVYDSRGTLYLECLRIIKEKKPRVFVFENVKGLLSTKHANGQKLIDVIADDLKSFGYNVNYQVLNAADYNTPQKRERLILVGIDCSLNKTFIFPEKQSRRGLELGNILNIDPSIPNQKDWPFSPQAMRLIHYIPEGGSWKSIPYDKLPERMKKIRDNMAKYHSPNFYRRFARKEIAGTITASAQPENCGIIHPVEDRRFNIREIARIQTFPDNFVFFDSTLSDVVAMYKVIGNAVPCNLAYAVAKEIMKQVFKND